jgi:hypothetical protein
MSAVEVIDQFKSLPPEEQVKVIEFVKSCEVRGRAAAEGQVDEEFKAMADHVFTKNAELFRKLAQ